MSCHSLARELDLLNDRAVEVVSLEGSGPADEASIRPGDLIYSINGRLVSDVDDMHRLLTRSPIGGQVTLGVIRDGNKLQIDVRPRPSV